MAKFKILRRVDSYVDYVAEIEAEDAASAASMAHQDPDAFRWLLRDVQEFPDHICVALDEGGGELPDTECRS